MKHPAHLVLEGSDCSGKTTLAGKLAALGYRVHHEGVPPDGEHVFDRYFRVLDELTRGGGAPVAFDRFHLGELVYGPLLRGGSRLTEGQLSLIDRLRRARGVLTVLCGPRDFETTLAAWRARRELELLEEEGQLREVWERYHLRGMKFDLRWDGLDLPGELPEVERIPDASIEAYANWERERRAT